MRHLLSRFRRALALPTIIFALSVGALLIGSGAFAAGKNGWPARITFVTGPTGGFGYTMSAPWAATVGSAVGIAISPEATNVIPINFRMLAAKEAEAAVGTSDIAVQGWRGEGYAKGRKIRNVRTMLMFVPYVFQIYADARSGIKTLSDLNGKIVNPSRAGSGTDVIFQGIVKTLGIKPKQITHVSPAQANDLMADGRLDVAIGTGNIPHPAPSQYEARSPINLIGFTQAQEQKYLAQNPQLSRMVVPAGTFKGQKKNVLTVGSYSMFVADKDLPASLVYDLIKATFAHKRDLANAYGAFGHLELKNILNSPIPLHPGAIKYFEEHGIHIPDKLKHG
jgi:TRAP transporter TAXI family solute receptor